MQHSNGSNPFLGPAEQHPDINSKHSSGNTPDTDAAQHEADAGTYSNPFLDMPADNSASHGNAYINPFTDAHTAEIAQSPDAYVNPFIDPYTDAATPAAGFVNPFEEHVPQGSARCCLHVLSLHQYMLQRLMQTAP